MAKLTIRPSSLAEFNDCQRRWAAKNLRKEIRATGIELPILPMSIAAPIGTGVHAGAALVLTDRKNITASNDGAVEALYTSVRECESGITFETMTRNMNNAESHVLRMTDVYRLTLPDEMEPHLIEKRAEINIGDGYTVSGQIDAVVGKRGRGQWHELEDLKTSARLPNASAQVGTYRLIQEAHGLAISKVLIKLIKRATLNKEQPPPQYFNVDKEAAEALATNTLARIKQYHRAFVKSGGDPNVYSANPSSMMCNPKFCPAHPAHGNGFCPFPLMEE